jgi:hypothetical protein
MCNFVESPRDKPSKAWQRKAAKEPIAMRNQGARSLRVLISSERIESSLLARGTE